tara:strand:+ start:391 stop:765 length:375 start_codon:yes stop_codon:yes gene_type:complete
MKNIYSLLLLLIILFNSIYLQYKLNTLERFMSLHDSIKYFDIINNKNSTGINDTNILNGIQEKNLNLIKKNIDTRNKIINKQLQKNKRNEQIIIELQKKLSEANEQGGTNQALIRLAKNELKNL